MEEKFSLMDKQKDGDWMYNGSNTTQKCYSEEDVKEFIRLLKEEMQKWRRLGYINDRCLLDYQDLLFELAGAKLV